MTRKTSLVTMLLLCLLSSCGLFRKKQKTFTENVKVQSSKVEEISKGVSSSSDTKALEVRQESSVNFTNLDSFGADSIKVSQDGSKTYYGVKANGFKKGSATSLKDSTALESNHNNIDTTKTIIKESANLESSQSKDTKYSPDTKTVVISLFLVLAAIVFYFWKIRPK